MKLCTFFRIPKPKVLLTEFYQMLINFIFANSLLLEDSLLFGNAYFNIYLNEKKDDNKKQTNLYPYLLDNMGTAYYGC